MPTHNAAAALVNNAQDDDTLIVIRIGPDGDSALVTGLTRPDDLIRATRMLLFECRGRRLVTSGALDAVLGGLPGDGPAGEEGE